MRLEEVEKYEACYRRKNYYMEKRRRLRAKKDIETIPRGSTYLDVGCGRGEALEIAREHEIWAIGTEIVPYLCDGERVIHAAIDDLPFQGIDYVSCYDVIEHIPPEDVAKSLDELFRVAKTTLFITTNDLESMWNGQKMHLTLRPKEWWEAEFEKRQYKTIEHCTFATERHWWWRINF